MTPTKSTSVLAALDNIFEANRITPVLRPTYIMWLDKIRKSVELQVVAEQVLLRKATS